MAFKIRIYYRTTARKTTLVLGYYVDNGAKHAKMTVIHDYTGKNEKNARIKLKIDDCGYVSVIIDPKELKGWTESDPLRVENYMRKRLRAALERHIDKLIKREEKQQDIN